MDETYLVCKVDCCTSISCFIIKCATRAYKMSHVSNMDTDLREIQKIIIIPLLLGLLEGLSECMFWGFDNLSVYHVEV